MSDYRSAHEGFFDKNYNNMCLYLGYHKITYYAT